MKLEFDKIGSIMEVDGSVGPLGPSCSYTYHLRNDLGPFKSSKDFLLAHVRAELDLLSNLDEWEHERTRWSHINGGFDNLSREYATQWFQLLEKALLATPDQAFHHDGTPFVLYHDDFSPNNILMSPYEQDIVVGIVDWEGSRVSPLWDSYRLYKFLPDITTDSSERDRLSDLEDGIYLGAQSCTGYSRLHLSTLSEIVDWGHSVRSSRAKLDNTFLEWMDGVTHLGRIDETEVKEFLPLKRFIDESRGVEDFAVCRVQATVSGVRVGA